MEAAMLSGVASGGSASNLAWGSTGNALSAKASQQDIAHFQQLLAGGSSPAGGVSASAVGSVAEGNLSSGIREGIKQAAEAYRSRFESLSAGLKKVEKSQSISSLLAWQLDSVKMGVEMEFTGKIASKVVQDIEQLTKQQG